MCIRDSLQVFQAHGQRQLVVVVDYQHRPQKFIPHAAERQDGRRGNGRLRIWQHDAEKHAQPRTAVDDGGVFQILGNAEEKLAEEKDVERIGACLLYTSPPAQIGRGKRLFSVP